MNWALCVYSRGKEEEFELTLKDAWQVEDEKDHSDLRKKCVEVLEC